MCQRTRGRVRGETVTYIHSSTFGKLGRYQDTITVFTASALEVGPCSDAQVLRCSGECSGELSV